MFNIWIRFSVGEIEAANRLYKMKKKMCKLSHFHGENLGEVLKTAKEEKENRQNRHKKHI